MHWYRGGEGHKGPRRYTEKIPVHVLNASQEILDFTLQVIKRYIPLKSSRGRRIWIFGMRWGERRGLEGNMVTYIFYDTLEKNILIGTQYNYPTLKTAGLLPELNTGS